MTKYVDSIEFTTIICYKCAIAFAVPSAFDRERHKDREMFYCPSGHGQVYLGPSEAQKLRTELERKQQILEAEQARAAKLERQRDDVARAHNRMRARIKNGVCPCCNRTFQKLLNHMRTEHADLPAVRTIREAFGLTQATLAEEIGVTPVYISNVERGKPVPAYAQRAIDSWVELQAGTGSAIVAGSKQ